MAMQVRGNRNKPHVYVRCTMGPGFVYTAHLEGKVVSSSTTVPMNLSSQIFSTTFQHPLVVMSDTSNEFFQSLQDHPTVWTLAFLTYVASCAVVWKLQLMALERNAASYSVREDAGTKPKESSSSSSKIAELKKLPWYTPKIGSKLNETMRVLLEEYGGIPRRDQEEHIYRIVSHLSLSSREAS